MRGDRMCAGRDRERERPAAGAQPDVEACEERQCSNGRLDGLKIRAFALTRMEKQANILLLVYTNMNFRAMGRGSPASKMVYTTKFANRANQTLNQEE